MIHSPTTPIAKPTKKGGKGVYNGEKGYPPRTSTPNGPPEKIRDEV